MPRRASSSFGTKNVESLSLHLTKHSDPNHVEFVLKIDRTQARSTEASNKEQRIFVNDLSSTKKFEEANMEENGAKDLLHFLPHSSARRTSNIQTGERGNSNLVHAKFEPNNEIFCQRLQIQIQI